MKIKSTYFRIAAFHPLRGRALFKYGFVVIWALLLAWQQSSASEENQHPEASPHQDLVIHIPSVSLQGFLSPFHLPFESVPVPAGQSIPDELDTDEDFDHDGHSVAEFHAAASLFQIAALGNIYRHPDCTVQNHATVPFFILYHSWKSFLA